MNRVTEETAIKLKSIYNLIAGAFYFGGDIYEMEFVNDSRYHNKFAAPLQYDVKDFFIGKSIFIDVIPYEEKWGYFVGKIGSEIVLLETGLEYEEAFETAINEAIDFYKENN